MNDSPETSNDVSSRPKPQIWYEDRLIQEKQVTHTTDAVRASPGHLAMCVHACLFGAVDATR